MKSEHRHQLKTNELAEWLVNFPKWAKENSTMIIYVSVVLVLAAGAYIWKVYETDVVSVRRHLAFTNSVSQIPQGKTRILRAQAQGVDIAYLLIQAADALRSIAQSTKDDEMAAFALIKEAEALRTELHYRFGAVSQQDLTEQINRAKDGYTKAIEKASGYPELLAMAKFGLGLCEEELGNFERAREIYSEIVANPEFKYTVIVPQAEQRLATMDTYRGEVVFRPAPTQEAPGAEFMRPAIDLNIPDDSLELPGPNIMSDIADFNVSG